MAVWVYPQPRTQSTAENTVLSFRTHLPNFHMKPTLQTYALMLPLFTQTNSRYTLTPPESSPTGVGQILLIAQH